MASASAAASSAASSASAAASAASSAGASVAAAAASAAGGSASAAASAASSGGGGASAAAAAAASAGTAWQHTAHMHVTISQYAVYVASKLSHCKFLPSVKECVPCSTDVGTDVPLSSHSLAQIASVHFLSGC